MHHLRRAERRVPDPQCICELAHMQLPLTRGERMRSSALVTSMHTTCDPGFVGVSRAGFPL